MKQTKTLFAAAGLAAGSVLMIYLIPFQGLITIEESLDPLISLGTKLFMLGFATAFGPLLDYVMGDGH